MTAAEEERARAKTKRQVRYEWSEYRWRRGDEESYVAKDEELSEEMRVRERNANDGVQLAACHSLQGVSCHCAGLLSHSSGLPRAHSRTDIHACTRTNREYTLVMNKPS